MGQTFVAPQRILKIISFAKSSDHFLHMSPLQRHTCALPLSWHGELRCTSYAISYRSGSSYFTTFWAAYSQDHFLCQKLRPFSAHVPPAKVHLCSPPKLAWGNRAHEETMTRQGNKDFVIERLFNCRVLSLQPFSISFHNIHCAALVMPHHIEVGLPIL